MTMRQLGARADLSWMRDLRKDPDADANAPNRKSRQVKSGHFVPVRPQPLPKPQLVIHSPVMAAELGLSEDACQSQEFLRFFSGEVDAVPGFDSWATPYALAIMGQPHYDNCPFKNGNGYGDGRAISIGEVVAPSGQRWEMQLKGAGPTPFCRGADGRAVLRSSIREFLASEAMHNLGVSTTRAISLIVSGEASIQRPWYSGEDSSAGFDEARLAQAPPELRQMLMMMLQQRQGEPDVMIREMCAITCRVAPSFVRIGHLDLFARRVSRSGGQQEKEELELICRHAFDREYSDVLPDAPLPERALAVFEAASQRIAVMVSKWLQVGFCQGNFNCDNCLIAGRTMDYGPFGFIDKYDPTFAKWVGSGDHFAFINQPGAAFANLTTLATSLEPVLDSSGKQALQEKLKNAKTVIQDTVSSMWCQKLGFKDRSASAQNLFEQLEELMRESNIDYTITFRQLAEIAGKPSNDASSLLAPLLPAFYDELSSTDYKRDKWVDWIQRWLQQLQSEGCLADAGERMKRVNPKYILREYMLVRAYEAAKEGDFTEVHQLYDLILNPYDEQPSKEEKYYRKAPTCALRKPGTAVMT
eukprot:gnl/MRDRNA2_/MRDRNA2_74326_c0_seq1.p1 gnl/MRDRNA2_/MRDRNA2_74326_c0~~gnl/MRDRNA2_/MRDRNA2_74326_c0_seq1.p1  ORF type:complete len:586 (-),score=114.24 gnl/MRDRNA2_/MRDRNA2_74326_c0_seq1:12-1769(-)